MEEDRYLLVKSSEYMPATSKQQQKLMGIVRALQTGDMKPGQASKKAQQMAKTMKPSDVKDFAATKHKGLPKKVKKENLEIPTMFLVRKPMYGMDQEKMVCEINPLEGIQPHNIEMADVYSLHTTMEEAQAIAAEAYKKCMEEVYALEEKKGQVGDKLKKTIDHLEKKRKEHLDMAKEDPKNAAKHKEHIAKLATQIDDLMTKMEKIEKSKKEIEKVEDKKDIKESTVLGENKLGNFLSQIKAAATNMAKNYYDDASKYVDVDKLKAEPISTDILNKAEKELTNKSQELSEGFKDNIAKFASGNILGAVISGLTTISTGLNYLDQRFTQWYYKTIQGLAEKDVMKIMVDTYGAKATESSIWFKVGTYAFFVFFVLAVLSLITLKIVNRKK